MRLSLLVFCLLITTFLKAQTSIITGKILDENNNQPLVGTTISIKETSIKTISDVDGVYKFKLKPGLYTISISYVGYATKEISGVAVTADQVLSLNISLSAAQNTTLQNVVVKTEARKEGINSLLIARKNAAVVSDAISADMIKRSPDKSVGDVLKRVSGTSIQDNKFVVVRGMSDRYNEALLNGAILPSTESDRKTFAFDIFPSDLVDNITIVKSASADLPGSFAGGLVNVTLKDIPDKNFFSIKIGSGLNTITTNHLFYHQKVGSSDFLGFDDGTRSLPDNFPSSNAYNALPSAKRVKLAQKFDKQDWKLYKNSYGPYNTSLQASGAVTATGKNGYPKFGALFGTSYNSTFKTSHIVNRDFGEVKILPDSVDTGLPYYDFKDTTFTHTILASALGNFTIKINPNNKFYFNNLLSVNSTIQTVTRGGESQAGSGTLSPYYAYVHNFQSNVMYNGQVGGEHYLSKYKLRIKWLTYYTNYHKDEPDYRQMIYVQPFENGPFFAYLGSPTLSTTTNTGTRFYYDTKDISKGVNLDFTKSFIFLNNAQSLKFGFSSFDDSRRHDGRFLRNDIGNFGSFKQSIQLLPPDKIFDPKNFNKTTGLVLTDFGAKQYYLYYGSQSNRAYYLMLDNKFTRNIRLSYGIRYEDYTNVLNSFKNPTKKVNFNKTFHDFLPSANFIYSVLPKANIRLSYNRSAVRPLYRELSATQFYDFIQNTTYFGGPLDETKIDNYEIRWEHYFNNAQYYSVSGFYKKFKNAIEQAIAIDGVDSRTITWQNVPKAHNEGIEAEARKNLDFISPALSNLYLYGNAAFIKSIVEVKGNGSDTANRPLAGQSPYIINASLQYSEPKTGINFSALYNVIGARISAIGGKQTNYYWEKLHPQLDFKISKTFLKNNGIAELSFADVLHKDDVYFWDENGNKKYDSRYPDVLVQSRSFGTTITVSVGYRF